MGRPHLRLRSPTVPQLALDGIRVLELTDGIAAPFCAKMLADYGAEVIRVEHPRPTRRQYEHLNWAESAALHLHLNLNKKSVTLDLELERGRELLLDLALRCGVVVESMRPGAVEGLGIGYETLSAHRPDLVMTSITPFGQTGPYRDWTYTELTAFAMSGAMNREGLPGRPPLKYGGEMAQYFTGVTASAATMGALVGAAMTGIGDRIDIAIFESMTGHPNQIARRGAYAYLGENDRRIEPRAAAVSEQYAVGTFRCADGYFNILPLGPRMWPNVAEMIGRPDLTEDPRYLTPQDRTDNRAELAALFQAWLDERTRYEVFAAAQDAGLPAGPVLEPAEIMEDEHFAQRGYFRTTDHPDFGTLRYTGLPFTLSDAPRSDPTPAPKLGRHNRETLSGILGLGDEEISELSERGIISDD